MKSAMFNNTNGTGYDLPGGFDWDMEVEDTNWILTSSFIIFTMQTGFGMLESGCVSIKNEVNIMMKNVVDIVVGGITYWMFGYGMSFGESPYNNPFVALGGFFVDPAVGDPMMGPTLGSFLFQLSFATTATTIVSGAMAERCNFKAYCIFSFLNTVIYCIPAGWVWGKHGFLYNMGVVDIAGSGPVHLIGGSAAFASAAMLGPRLGRYIKGRAPLPPGSPVNAVLGLFVLWWGWLAFNSGSTNGISGAKWQYAARAAVMTVIGSFGGGSVSLIYSLVRFKGKLDLMDLVNGVLGSLVAVTAGCFLYNAWESLFIGALGSMIACLTMPIIDAIGVDDPVGASSVHGCAGIWGVIAVGLFADNPQPLDTTNGRSGLFKGGGWYLLKVQCLSALCLCVWSLVTTTIMLWTINKFIPIRMEEREEVLGADLCEHMILHGQAGVTEMLEILKQQENVDEYENLIPIGTNPGHKFYLEEKYSKKTWSQNINEKMYYKYDEEIGKKQKGNIYPLIYETNAINLPYAKFLPQKISNKFKKSKITPIKIQNKNDDKEFVTYNGKRYEIFRANKNTHNWVQNLKLSPNTNEKILPKIKFSDDEKIQNNWID